jgi:acyl carrier protein
MIELKDVLPFFAALEPPPDLARFDPVATFQVNGIDSLDLMTVYLAIEEHFGVKLTDPELERIHSVADIVTALQRKLGGQ